MYKAHQGPAGALTELVGYLGGTTRVTALHQTPGFEVFTTSGTWDWAAAGSPATVDVLLVAGGGGGGGDFGGGGGGAGGVREVLDVSVSSDVTVTVGDGGAGAMDPGNNGSDSSFGALTATGGGGGGGGWTNSIESRGRDGGSGGGAGRGGHTGDGQYGGSGVAGQGHDGGGNLSVNETAGGGGGKAEAGKNPSVTPVKGGDGGDGVTLESIGWSVEGAPAAVGGGGGGGTSGGADRYAGYGGFGGGGDAGPNASANTTGIGSAGTANTGGGGGGGHSQDGTNYIGGDGGTGLVIVRWPGGYTPPPPETTLLGVGSASTSLTDYPKTGSVTTGDIWVDPNAGSNGNGSQGSPFDNLASAFAAVSDGERIIVRGGTFNLNSAISRSTNWTNGIQVFAYGNERVIIDGATNPNTGNMSGNILTPSGAREHWKGFEFRNARNHTTFITGSHYKFEDCWGSNGYNSGFRIFGENPTGNVFQDCVAWNMGHAGGTGVDAFVCSGPGPENRNKGGNYFVRCYAERGADDCYDILRSYDNHIIDCIAHKAGYWWNGSQDVQVGNGTGFKMGDGQGPPSNPGGSTIRGCLAIGNYLHGITHNFTPNPIDIHQCTSVNNVWVGYQNATDGGLFRNNIAFGNGGPSDGKSDTTIDGNHNTWNLNITQPQFANPSAHDYSLASGSPCIGAAHDGGNLGASTIALEIAKEWLAKDLS